MAYRYAISDPHGRLDVLGRALDALDLADGSEIYLLGDYIPHETVAMSPEEYENRCADALAFVHDFQAERAGRVHVLAGNHELMLVDRALAGEFSVDPKLARWVSRLPAHLETDEQVFVHAGVDEQAGDFWRTGSEPWYFCSKVHPSFGWFQKDVVAGHVGASGLAARFGHPGYLGVFWDGASHYYIDGTTERSGCIPILRYDAKRGAYDQMLATADGVSEPAPVDAFMSW